MVAGALLLAVTRPAPTALAQGALIEGIVTGPAGLCLDLEGAWSSARPPPDGTAVVLSTCDGSDDQRWSYGVGDYQGDFMGIAHTTLIAQGNGAVSAPFDHAWAANFGGTGPIRVGRGCLTADATPTSGARLRIEPCHGGASQEFALSR